MDTSSLAIRMSSVTLENTVGSMKKPFLPSPLPPHSSFAPSVMPLWISSRILLYCFLSILKVEEAVLVYCLRVLLTTNQNESESMFTNTHFGSNLRGTKYLPLLLTSSSQRIV